MTTQLPRLTDHHHAFNFHTGRHRFHFEEPPPPPQSPPPQAPPPAAWHTGIDAELLGHAQNKGWDMNDPKAAFAGAVKQARELERHFGVPPDRLVRLPAADAKPEDLRAFYERIGAPKEAKDYDLSPLKDGTLAEALRPILHERGVSKDAAGAVAAALEKAMESKAATDSTVLDAKLVEQQANLEKSWGTKESATYKFNLIQAQEGARKLGIAPEGVAAAEKLIGYDKLMESLRRIGANTREDTFVERGVGGTGTVTTVEGAMARRAELMADQAWGKRYLEGGAAEKAEMTRLNTIISGVE